MHFWYFKKKKNEMKGKSSAKKHSTDNNVFTVDTLLTQES